jgi:GT2 family glycosyltransferase
MVVELDKEGNEAGWKYHPATHPHCFITFCQAFSRTAATMVGGFDENYVGWGYEDNDFNFRLQFSGVKCMHVNALVAHQWHPSGQDEASSCSKYYAGRLAAIKAERETFIANVGKSWGDANS